MLSLNYDAKNDILYLAFAVKSASYGDEVVDGYVIMRDLFSENITGLTIFDFMTKYNNNKLLNLDLPVSIDYQNDVIPLL